MKTAKFILTIAICAIAFAFTKSNIKNEWELLFNGKNLKGWDTYIGPDLNDSGKFISALPIGLNNDPRHVFTIVKVDGENLIRISGENWGAISTVKEYENYHLQLQFKWGTLTWGQKKGKKKDSGLLYHSVGKRGADYGAWMRSQEFQIEETNTGDYWGVAGGMADYLGVDPTVVRIVWVLAAFAIFPIAPIAYFTLAMITPQEPVSNSDAYMI